MEQEIADLRKEVERLTQLVEAGRNFDSLEFELATERDRFIKNGVIDATVTTANAGIPCVINGIKVFVLVNKP